MRGTDADERFELLGGPVDGVNGGGGSDVFVFADQEGVRDSLRVLDFNPDEDFLDLGGAEIASTSPAGSDGLTIRIDNDDRDYIYLSGVNDLEQVQLFTGEVSDPELPELLGTAGVSDRLTGTDIAERIDGLGGPIDSLRGGGGGDEFVFTDTDGLRDSLRILDYEIGVDSIELSGASIRSFSVFDAGLYLRVENADRDAIFVSDVFETEDLTFSDGTILA